MKTEQDLTPQEKAQEYKDECRKTRIAVKKWWAKHDPDYARIRS